MSHFAQIDEQNIVTQVIVAEQDFIDGLTDSGSWVQTSYNTYGGKHYDPETGLEDDVTPLRKNYAGIGYTYDSDRDAFIPPKPYESWVLNEDECLWYSPVECPELTQEQIDSRTYYKWDEETLSWVLADAINQS